MSEKYQYAECRHCGQTIMEGQIHNCRNMYLTEIEELREQVAIYKDQRDDWALDRGRFRDALVRIASNDLGEAGCKRIAREALADRP